jgi:hypothetical protein
LYYYSEDAYKTSKMRNYLMKAKKKQTGRIQERNITPEKQDRKKATEAYGDKAPICINVGCVLRKKATCFGFEGCPGFKAR